MRTISDLLKGKSQRTYTVVGYIDYTLATPETVPNHEFLFNVVKNLEDLIPWQSEDGDARLSPGVIAESDFGKKIYRIELKLGAPLSKGQLHAFENHIDKIAETLSDHWLRIPGVVAIEGTVQTRTSISRAMCFKDRPLCA